MRCRSLDYYLGHRAERLDQVREAVAAGAVEPMDVVRTVYADVDERLWPAAELSVRAQLDYLGLPELARLARVVRRRTTAPVIQVDDRGGRRDRTSRRA